VGLALGAPRAARGRAERAVAVLADITRLKIQQAELEKLLRDRELMFSLSEVGIVYQRGTRIERANQAMATLTGYTPPELNTLDAAELYEDARACVDFEARVAEGLRAHGRYSGERRLRRRDGRLTWVQVAVRRVDGDDAGPASSAPSSMSTNATARANRWRCRPSARGPSSIRCWWASSLSPSAASSG